MDLAQERNAEFIADILADHQRRHATGVSLTHCVDCEEKIPEARRVAVPGCKRCIDCQTDLENWRPL
jgi:phage/conjugal plasmid C-4 type zinc finger TraR family protein